MVEATFIDRSSSESRADVSDSYIYLSYAALIDSKIDFNMIWYVFYTVMEFEYDSTKSAANREKHGGIIWAVLYTLRNKTYG